MKRRRLVVVFFVLTLFFLEPIKANDTIWLFIDTQKLQLKVKQGNKTLVMMENIAIGRRGAGFKRRIGDDITPLGSYKIAWVNKKSQFHRFYGINYPSKENADQALSMGLLSPQIHASIIQAHKKNKIPPQQTSIGGRIGIHGLGGADKTIHNKMNWTHGCIALTNEQIDQLTPWMSKNMRVKIK